MAIPANDLPRLAALGAAIEGLRARAGQRVRVRIELAWVEAGAVRHEELRDVVPARFLDVLRIDGEGVWATNVQAREGSLPAGPTPIEASISVAW